MKWIVTCHWPGFGLNPNTVTYTQISCTIEAETRNEAAKIATAAEFMLDPRDESIFLPTKSIVRIEVTPAPLNVQGDPRSVQG